MLPFHGIPLLFAVPTGDGNQHIRVTNFPVQLCSARARRLLDDLAGTNPGIGVFLCRVPFSYANLEDVFHEFTLVPNGNFPNNGPLTLRVIVLILDRIGKCLQINLAIPGT